MFIIIQNKFIQDDDIVLHSHKLLSIKGHLSTKK